MDIKSKSDESVVEAVESMASQPSHPSGAKGDDSFWRIKGSFPNIADIAVIYVAFILSQLLGQLIAHMVGLGGYDSHQLLASDEYVRYAAQYAYGLYSLVSYGSAMLIALLFIVLWKFFRGDRGRLLYFVRGANLSSVTLWGVILTLCLGVALEPLLEFLPKVPRYDGRGLPAIISLVIIAPIFEEIICRGVILSALWRKGGVVLALLVSSLFFALLHVHVTLVVNSFIMGLMLGYFYIRTRSIIVPIILHAINNAMAYIMLYTNNSDFTLSDVILNGDVYYTIYALSLLLLIISAVKIARKIDVMSRADDSTGRENSESTAETLK